MSRPNSARSADHSSTRAAPRRHRGLVESTQWALLIPVLMLGILGVIQGGIFLAGRAAVQQAAMAGAEHAAFADAGPGAATAVATDVASRAGLSNIEVNVESTGAGIQVSVRAEVASVLPGDWSIVEAAAYRAKEG